MGKALKFVEAERAAQAAPELEERELIYSRAKSALVEPVVLAGPSKKLAAQPQPEPIPIPIHTFD